MIGYRVHDTASNTDVTNDMDWVMTPDGKLYELDYGDLIGHTNCTIKALDTQHGSNLRRLQGVIIMIVEQVEQVDMANYQLSDNDKLIISNIINNIIQEQKPVQFCPCALEMFCHIIIKYHRDGEDRDYNDDIDAEWSRLAQWAKEEIHKSITTNYDAKK